MRSDRVYRVCRRRPALNKTTRTIDNTKTVCVVWRAALVDAKDCLFLVLGTRTLSEIMAERESIALQAQEVLDEGLDEQKKISRFTRTQT